MKQALRLPLVLAVCWIIFFTMALPTDAEITFYPDRASWQAAVSGRTDIDFENVSAFPNGIAVPPGLTVSGVNFSLVCSQPRPPGEEPEFFVYNYFTSRELAMACFNSVGQMTVTFPSGGVTALSLDLGSTTYGRRFNIRLSTSEGTVEISRTYSSGMHFLGFTSSAPITSMQFYNLFGTNVALIDNVSFKVSSNASQDCQVKDFLRVSQCQGKPDHWGGETYAFMKDGTTICGAGCALTSLSAMLLNQLVSTLPVNTSMEVNDPGHLNDFMKEPAHMGYQGLGSVGWTSTVADVSAALNLQKRLTFNTDYWNSSSSKDLEKALCDSQRPVAVGVKLNCPVAVCKDPKPTPGHFVVVYGKVGNDFLIADPSGNPRSRLSEYGEFLIRGFIEDPADNSRLDVSTGPNADILLIGPDNARTGFDVTTGQSIKTIQRSYYSRDSLLDDETGAPITGITYAVGVFQPKQGSYRIVVSGLASSTYSVLIRAFSQDGRPQLPTSVSGIAVPGSTTTFDVQFDSVPGSNSVVARVATFQSTLADINNSLQLGLIGNKGIANSLSQKLEAAEKATGPARMNILNAFKNEVNAQSGKHITGIAPQVLLQDADSLISQSR